MIKEDFRELRFIKKEIELLKSDIAELHNTLRGTGVGGCKNSGVSDTVGRAIELIDEKERLLNEALLRCVSKENAILSEIYGVSDSRIRMILKLRFIDGLSWVKTAQELGVTVESAKMAYKRWEERRCCSASLQQ